MVTISIYGLDQYTVGHYSKEHTANLASLLEVDEKDVVFYARIGGKCNKDELQEKKRINLDETGQTADVRVRDGSEVYWKECGEDCKAFGKCIKMKDLLR